MNGQKHIINREILELTVPDRELAMPLQNKASEFVKQKLNPALDKLFSKLSSKDKVVQIDSLVLDLGTIGLKKLDDDFLQLALKNAEDQLTGLILKAKTELENSNAFSTSEESENVKIKSLKSTYLDQFIHFLETGNLSWWKSDEDKNPFNTTFDQVMLIDKSSFQEQLLPLLSQPKVRKRLTYQLNDEQLKIYSDKLDSRSSENKKVFLIKVETFFTGSKKGFSPFRDAYWVTVLESVSEGEMLASQDQKITFLKNLLAEGSTSVDKVSMEKFLSVLLKKLITEPESATDKTIQLMVNTVFEFSMETGLNTKKLIRVVQKTDFEKSNEVENTFDRLKKKMESDDASSGRKKHVNKSLKRKKEKAKLSTFKSVKKEDTSLKRTVGKNPEADDLFISNAGIVILHPFLKHFFNGLGLLDNELQFKSFDHAVKAIHLLQFIATKTRSFPEHELSLNKILCGIDISEPIPQRVALKKSELEECENLLSVVLDRWEVLKTKDTNSLRETFLKREGILKQANQGWQLQIERNSFDVLIDRLPWGLNLIKLPWNTQIIHVEW